MIGMMLFVSHWFDFSPAVVTPVLDILCYLLAMKYLGSSFIRISLVSTMCVSAFLKLWEQFPPVIPDLTALPLMAAVCGGIFVGVGVGLIVRQGGSSGGDDALALTISSVTKCRISRAYLLTDLIVLGLSLTYIPMGRIGFSLITVTISSFLIEKIQKA